MNETIGTISFPFAIIVLTVASQSFRTAQEERSKSCFPVFFCWKEEGFRLFPRHGDENKSPFRTGFNLWQNSGGMYMKFEGPTIPDQGQKKNI
jgi:hypothetical protein